MERFNRTVPDEFSRHASRNKSYEPAGALQKDLDRWLERYDFERPHQGHRNMDRRPFDTVKKFIKLT